ARDEARVTILGVPDHPGVVHRIFRQIAEANVVVDMIVQNVAKGGRTEVSFTVASDDLAETTAAAEVAARAIGATGVTHSGGLAKVSVVGLGMRTHTGVADTMFEALAAAGVNLEMITTSEIKISVLVNRESGKAALAAVHRAFGLDTLSQVTPAAFSTERSATHALRKPAATVNGTRPESAPGMEELVISGVELDENQARVTLFNVPDQPGYAAGVFSRIAEAGVFVDMIVQNVSTAGKTLLSFTVPRDAAQRAADAVRAFGAGDVSIEPGLAKLSVLGVGMRTHTGVATRMFGALAERGINITLINTSEVRINIATDLDRGREALDCLRRAFALPEVP
ncbi:MAG: ACT domain-containing protein, partial [Planctomycetia bacterium]|nr:ACT domain-containing protein [Planctomycetia bacterium]